jgi:hypothetical protein
LPVNAQVTTTAQRAKRANTASIAPKRAVRVGLRSGWKKAVSPVQMDPLHVWASTGPIITGLFTAIFGLLGYILGQVFLKLIEPALEFRARIGAIARDLILYANRNVPIADDSTRLTRKFHEEGKKISEVFL